MGYPLFSLLTLTMAWFMPRATADAGEKIYPDRSWPTAAPEEVGMDKAVLKMAREYALKGQGSGMITRHGKVILTWGDLNRKYDLKSTTKSIGITALGLAIKDAKMKLSHPAQRYHSGLGIPPNTNDKTEWLKDITLLHLATQTAGFEKPGGYRRLLFKPGTKWHYSDGGPNWLAECITLTYKRDLEKLLFERIFDHLGITKKDLHWRKNQYRKHTISGIPRREIGSGCHANVDAMARIGYLYLRDGKWKEKQLLPQTFISQLSTTVPSVKGLPEHKNKEHGNASEHYGLLWWNNADGSIPKVPKDAYWSWGLHDSLIVVIPSLDIVVSRAGRGWERTRKEHYAVLEPFLLPIVQSVKERSAAKPLIRRVTWAPKGTILRKAKGSDNWPLTWGDDDAIYTAYGDGYGFRPFRKGKLSLGIAKVTGSPRDFQGVNIPAPTIEQKGGGRSGKKASGMLMVNQVLYLWARNANNAQLAWSIDYGKTWKWAKWRFTESFGCPTFLNYGRNYSGARDHYIYIYSFDSDSAYKPADRMVLARAPKEKLTDRSAYEFFKDFNNGIPRWTKSIKERGAILTKKGQCYRTGVSYNPGIRRYLMVQTPGGDTRYKGGFTIYEAKEPWGPWHTVFTTKQWDVGPGESASFPTKWISKDGKTLYLVFSGNDCFSVRKATLTLRSP